MLASQPQETDSDLPKRFHTSGVRVKQNKKHNMKNEADKFATGLPSKVRRPGGSQSPILSERRQNMALMLKKQEGQGEPCPWGSSNSVEDDGTLVQDAQEKMENGQTPTEGFLSKYVPPEFINMAGDGISPKKLDSLSNDVTFFKKYGVNYKIGNNTRSGGAVNCNVSLNDTKVIAMSSTQSMPNVLPISPAMAKKINDDIKYQLRKEVRKFGRKFERIFILLEEVQGPPEVKKQFVEFTIKEAARFKRQVLIQDLEKVLEKIDTHHLLNKHNDMKNK